MDKSVSNQILLHSSIYTNFQTLYPTLFQRPPPSSQQICHRDLILENTLLDGSPTPRLKICDFAYSKQKVVIKVPMNGEKSRNKATKVVARALGLLVISRLLRKHSDSHSIATQNKSRAMTIAVGLSGVESVSLKGQEKNELEVIGNEIDSVKLTKLLRKNIGFAEIMAVSAVDEKKETKTENDPYYYSYGGLPHYQVFEYPVYQPSCFFF